MDKDTPAMLVFTSMRGGRSVPQRSAGLWAQHQSLGSWCYRGTLIAHPRILALSSFTLAGVYLLHPCGRGNSAISDA